MDAMDSAAVLDHEFVREVDAFMIEVPMGGSADLDALAASSEPAGRVTVDDIIASGRVTPTVQAILERRAALARAADFAAGYERALTQRARLQNLVDALFEHHDLVAVAYPCQQVTAALIGERQTGNRPSNLSSNTGWPALTIPAGLTADALAAGIEFMGRPFSEVALLALGAAYEAVSGRRIPPPGLPVLGP
jgi:amidase